MVTEAELYTPTDPTHSVAVSRRGGGGRFDAFIYGPPRVSADGFPSLVAAQRWVASKVVT